MKRASIIPVTNRNQEEMNIILPDVKSRDDFKPILGSDGEPLNKPKPFGFASGVTNTKSGRV